MSNFEIAKVSFIHQPGQVGSGQGFLAVKSTTVQSSGGLFVNVLFEQKFALWCPQIPIVSFGHLGLGVIGNVRFSVTSITLHAKSKVISGLLFVALYGASLATPSDGDKAKFSSLLDSLGQRLRGEQQVRVPESTGRIDKNSAAVFLQLCLRQVPARQKFALQDFRNACKGGGVRSQTTLDRTPVEKMTRG